MMKTIKNLFTILCLILLSCSGTKNIIAKYDKDKYIVIPELINYKIDSVIDNHYIIKLYYADGTAIYSFYNPR